MKLSATATLGNLHSSSTPRCQEQVTRLMYEIKYRWYPWYPALIISPKMPRTGYLFVFYVQAISTTVCPSLCRPSRCSTQPRPTPSPTTSSCSSTPRGPGSGFPGLCVCIEVATLLTKLIELKYTQLTDRDPDSNLSFDAKYLNNSITPPSNLPHGQHLI